jgi:ABC-type phosphate transport system permease subunit
MANLPVVIFQFAMSPYDNWVSLAWGGALLITFSVLLLNVLSHPVQAKIPANSPSDRHDYCSSNGKPR